ncbi:hypothetical protein Q7C_2726 (plasmid) [Methylophaga frappieri]|uniref:Uncharacterized protein n=1 Tax=Methylophaga frappieri (strain ATCC BAA-2434 / DSM 25690 / JAM7) TaxID=754477 RepID=I1YLQ3_METFJ|nr:hypothetical protein Q7C_2726 [Methylophaga frappieri]
MAAQALPAQAKGMKGWLWLALFLPVITWLLKAFRRSR